MILLGSLNVLNSQNNFIRKDLIFAEVEAQRG